MYSCTECSWEATDEEVDEMEYTDEVHCPECNSETDWWDGTEEEELW